MPDEVLPSDVIRGRDSCYVCVQIAEAGDEQDPPSGRGCNHQVHAGWFAVPETFIIRHM